MNIIKLLSFAFAVGATGLGYASTFSDVNETVFFYDIEVYDLPMDMDAAGKIVAETLQSFPEGKACVDFQAQGSAGKIGGVEHGSFMLVSNASLSSGLQRKISDLLCENAKPLTTCKIAVKFDAIDSKYLFLEVESFAPEAAVDLRNRHPKTNQKLYWLKHRSPLPRFSNGCLTGNNQESWTNAAASEESKQLLRELEVDTSRIRTLGLSQKRHLYTLGFYKHAPLKTEEK